MSASVRFRAVFIGGDSLLLECVELWLDKGHAVCAIVTGAARVRRWAEERRLQVLDLESDYVAALAADSFDYLFAITHLAILPDRLLGLPKHGSINFHDGPLP